VILDYRDIKPFEGIQKRDRSLRPPRGFRGLMPMYKDDVELEILACFFRDMNRCNSTEGRLEMLSKYIGMREVEKAISFVFDPHKFSHSSGCAIIRNPFIFKFQTHNVIIGDVYEYMEYCRTSDSSILKLLNIGGNFLIRRPRFLSVLIGIIDKTMRIGLDSDQIRSVFGESIIPMMKFRHQVHVSHVYNVGSSGSWYAAPCPAGEIVYVVYDNMNEVHIMNKKGREFVYLPMITRWITDLRVRNVVLQCVLTVLDVDCTNKESGVEDPVHWSEVYMYYRNIRMVIDNNHKHYHLVAFDMITLDEYNAGFSSRLYSERFEMLKSAYQEYRPTRMSVLKMKDIGDIKNMQSVVDEALMLPICTRQQLLFVENCGYDYTATQLLYDNIDEVDVVEVISGNRNYLLRDRHKKPLDKRVLPDSMDMLDNESIVKLMVGNKTDPHEIDDGWETRVIDKRPSVIRGDGWGVYVKYK